MNLIIVESPTKARTISRFLGSDFNIQSSYGHIRDLPKSEFGIDTENDFEPKYIIPTKARKNVTALKKYASKSDKIILATDEDREGEAIAWHITKALGLEKSKLKSQKSPAFRSHLDSVEDGSPREAGRAKTVERIVFHEITKSAIEEALKNPREIDDNLVDAQQARRILDRLVGYKLSPFLWKKVARGLSAGRVQSVAVRLIVEREKEIEKFKPEEYWSITAFLNKKQSKDEIIEAYLYKIQDKTVEKLEIKNQVEVDKILKNLEDTNWKVISLESSEISRSPTAPFTTSTLQQEGVRKLRFSSKQTMMIAQQLYEGVEIGSEGSVGLITYMRTDSVNLSEESLTRAKSFISSTFGENYLQQRRYKTKSKSAQEAHEAIRPTHPEKTPDEIKQYLTPQQLKLYTLIWSRFIASQMKPAIFDSKTIDIKAADMIFRATGSTLKFDGFLKIYPLKYAENNLPQVTEGEELDLKELKPEQHFTKPPARYNEASLIKTLEKEGVGRPSTYAPTISTIQQRNYVNKDRSRYFHPTEIGVIVNDLLVDNFPQIVDIQFTSKMEAELDDIAEGKLKWVPVIREFYIPFEKNLAEKYEMVSKDEIIQPEETDLICEKCGSKMVVKFGRFGKFTACSNFPTCKNILKDGKSKEEPEKTGEKCDKCGEGEMVIRNGRFGKFLACSRYPKCKNTKKIAQDNAGDNPPDKESNEDSKEGDADE